MWDVWVRKPCGSRKDVLLVTFSFLAFGTNSVSHDLDGTET